ncbi:MULTISPECIES: helix-turn-helix domain-containing protein [unclassified Methylococcus]|uniref:helix-turn-helix domain-containing protein n=1 Tax=unclassified Methylococcus TaxID=2618889 RepID=UPI003D7EDF82
MRNEPSLKTLGGRLRAVRESLELGQVEFAGSLSVHARTYQNYEKDVRQPPADFVTAICDQYGVEPAWLLTGEGEMRKAKRLSTEETAAGLLSHSGAAERLTPDVNAAEETAEVIDTKLLAELLMALDEAFLAAGRIAPVEDRAEMVARTYADIVEVAHDSKTRRMGAKMAREIFSRAALLFKPGR